MNAKRRANAIDGANVRRARVWPALALALALVAVRCDVAGADPPPARADRIHPVVERAVDRTIVAVFARFRADVRRLERVVTSYCTSPSRIAWRRLSHAFRESTGSFGAVSVFRFGPAVETLEIERLGTPVVGATFVRAEVDALITGTGGLAPPTTVAEVAAGPFALQGLPALERILLIGFAEEMPDIPESRCRLARLVAAHLSLIAADMHGDWISDEGFTATFLRPGEDNPRFRSLRALARAMLDVGVSEIARLGRELSPLAAEGEAPPAMVDPRTFTFRDHQVVFLRGKAIGLARFFSDAAFGRLLPDPAGGTLEETVARLASAAEVLGAVVDARGVPAPDAVAEATRHVAVARQLVAEELAAALELPLPDYFDLLR